MRSFDRAMPEELNRVLTDHLATCCCARRRPRSTTCAREGVAGAVELVGDVMVDVAHALPAARAGDDEPLRTPAFEPRRYVLATAHRAGNVDDPRPPASARRPAARASPSDVVLPLHPRTRARLEARGLARASSRRPSTSSCSPPLGYLDFTALLVHARAVLTDSGGVQKEAYLAGVPCVTLRDTTEWVETVDAGWNVLVDLDATRRSRRSQRTPPAERPELYGDGRAGERVVDARLMRA